MTVETASYISQLNPSYPAAGDPKSEGDDHIRLVKTALQGSFPSIGATAVTATGAELNYVAGATSNLQTQLSARSLKAGDTYTGTHDFTGATINVPTASASDNDTSAANTAFVQSAILASSGVSAVLPGQGGNSGKYLTTNGTTASWGAVTIPTPGLTLLATLTPTAAANVDFLTTFSSTYDNYLIIGEGIKPAANDSLLLNFAKAGVSDGANVYLYASSANSPFATSAFSVPISGTVISSGIGCSFVFYVQNVNDATNIKSFQNTAAAQSAATPTYSGTNQFGAYVSSNTITGLRLSWSAASNFAATGKVRVYGYSNT